MRIIFWISAFYSLTRTIAANDLAHLLLYGSLFALSAAAIVVSDSIIKS